MVRITDDFWNRYREIVRTEMLPYQWRVLNDEADVEIVRERNDGDSPNEKSHAIENFRIAAGRAEGDHYGWVFQDSDVYKWLEAAAFTLRSHPEDKELRDLADSVVELIAAAQMDDGYLNTYYTIRYPERRFHRMAESHELYCAGHFFEAACAYYEATGNEQVLDTARRFADCIERTFGEGKEVDGFDGHEEVKIGLMKLYRVTGDKRYLDLTKYFLDVRGTKPDFFREQLENDPGEDPIKGVSNASLQYFQADIKPVDQTVARGHAVRQVYLLTAMADYAAESGDEAMLAACERLWEDITRRQMYITGGIGSTVHGEAFTLDYNLPNDTMYCETCASVGLIFFSRQMLRNELRGEYADIMERVLYNGAISGMALDGRHFFYVNPLEVVPEACEKDPGRPHVMPVRPSWLGCACCPPNLARLLASLDDYIYTVSGDTVAVNLYIGSEGEFVLGGASASRASGAAEGVSDAGESDGERRLTLRIETRYPEIGEVTIHANGEGRLAIRIPGYADEAHITRNGEEISYAAVGQSSPLGGADEETYTISGIRRRNGYAYLEGPFADEDIVLSFDIKPILWSAHPYVRADIGKIAVSRGSFVYCAESVDNGEHLEMLELDADADYRYEVEDGELGHIGVLYTQGLRIQPPKDGALYRRVVGMGSAEVSEPTEIRLIPYYAWANRGENEMSVWLRKLNW